MTRPSSKTRAKSFEELIARDDVDVIIEDPRAATPGLGLVLWIEAAYGDRAGEIWSGLWRRVVTMAPDWSSAYNLFLNGEADMVLSYTTSPAYHVVADGIDKYATANFAEGHYAQIEIAGIINSSPNKALASQFLAWLVSPEAQATIPTTNWMYPVTALPETPAGFADLAVPEKTLLLPDDAVTANAEDWIETALGAQN